MGSPLDLFVDPDRFFEQKRVDSSLLVPIAIVLLIAAIATISGVAVFLKMLTAFGESGEARGIFMGVAVATGAFTFFAAIFMYGLYAGLTHLVSVFFDGEGSVSKTFSLVGWAMVPRLIGVLLSLGLTLYLISQMPDFENARQIMQYSQQMQNSTLNTVGQFLQIPFKLWSGALVVFAVKHARDVTQKQAAIATAVPLVIDVGIVLVGVLLNAVF